MVMSCPEKQRTFVVYSDNKGSELLPLYLIYCKFCGSVIGRKDYGF